MGEFQPQNNIENKETNREKIIQDGELILSRLNILERAFPLDDPAPFKDFEGSTLGWNYEGQWAIYNTHLSERQLLFLLAAVADSVSGEVLDSLKNRSKWANALSYEEKEDFVKEVEQKQPFVGLKVLDLGCGKWPVLARVMRKLGATVYTADQISKEYIAKRYIHNLEKREPKESEEREIKTEQASHIQVNLSDRDAVKKIEEIAGVNFDYVTESNLDTDFDYEKYGAPGAMGTTAGSGLASKLLRKGGIYFNASTGDENQFFIQK